MHFDDKIAFILIGRDMDNPLLFPPRDHTLFVFHSTKIRKCGFYSCSFRLSDNIDHKVISYHKMVGVLMRCCFNSMQCMSSAIVHTDTDELLSLLPSLLINLRTRYTALKYQLA